MDAIGFRLFLLGASCVVALAVILNDPADMGSSNAHYQAGTATMAASD